MKSSSNNPSAGIRRDGAPAAVRWTPDELAGAGFTDGFDPHMHSVAPNVSAADELRVRLEEAYAAGYAEGSATAGAQERSRLALAVRAAEDALAQLREGERRWVANAEANICALAVVAARHVVDGEIASAPEMVRSVVARALIDFPLDQAATVRVNPTDLPLLTSAAGLDATGLVSRLDTNWVGDARVGRGGCVIEGRDRIIDGRVDTALERLYRSLSGSNA